MSVEFAMAAFAVDYRKIIQIAVPLAAALIAISSGRMSAQARPDSVPAAAPANHMLVIPASDGYDFDDCLGSKKACGQVIADAWCEAHGMSASLSFGRADDVTASLPVKADAIKVASAPKLEPGSFIVNCKD